MPTSKIISGKTTFRSTYADSNALWQVVRSLGKGTYLCEIVNETVEIDGKVYNGDYAGVQKAFLRTEILTSLNFQDFWSNLKNDCEDFYNLLREGQIVHYSNGFGQFIRCEVVRVDDKIQLKSIALVGNWRDFDLPRRYPDGGIEYGYYPKKVMEQEVFRPNASNIWEFKSEGDDPSLLNPIDITVPDMTPEQSHVADLWVRVNRIRGMLENHSNDPQAVLDRVREYVRSF